MHFKCQLASTRGCPGSWEHVWVLWEVSPENNGEGEDGQAGWAPSPRSGTLTEQKAGDGHSALELGSPLPPWTSELWLPQPLDPALCLQCDSNRVRQILQGESKPQADTCRVSKEGSHRDGEGRSFECKRIQKIRENKDSTRLKFNSRRNS